MAPTAKDAVADTIAAIAEGLGDAVAEVVSEGLAAANATTMIAAEGLGEVAIV